jgi:hypothetical protein
MKPNKHIRKPEGYCCLNCDGPFSTWKKKKAKEKAASEVIQMDEDRPSGAV